MTIAEILKAKGVDDKIIKGVQDEMKANKIFTASEENLDIRYGKLKTDHDGKVAELTEAQNLIAEMKKATKGQEGLQQKITDYEAQVTQLQSELEQTKLDAAIKVELLSSKALDVEYLTFKLKEKGDLSLDEQGKIKGWEDKISALKTQFPTQFEAAGKNKNILENRLPEGNDNKAVSKEEFLKMGVEERSRFREENEQLYKTYTGRV